MLGLTALGICIKLAGLSNVKGAIKSVLNDTFAVKYPDSEAAEIAFRDRLGLSHFRRKLRE